MQRTVNVDVSASSMPIVWMQPGDAAGPLPGLILCHHREGVDEFPLDAARRLAEHGYAVATPNMYHRRPADEPWEKSRKTMRDLDIAADLRATADLLSKEASVRPGKIGIIGHCMGGRTAFLGAALLPQVASAVILYGGGIFRTEGEGMATPASLAKDIRASMLALYGEKDHAIPMDEINQVIELLKTINIHHEFHLYPNVGHAFQDFSRPTLYSEAVSEDAWIRCLNFLDETLRGAHF